MTRCGRQPAGSKRPASTAALPDAPIFLDRWRSGLTWLLLAIVGALLVRRYFDVVEVRGQSMAPTLRPGDRLLVVRRGPRVGDIVLAQDPRDPRRELIKRVARVDGLGVILRGDNPAGSTDARIFGVVPTDEVEWRALLRYWPLSRVGRAPSRTTNASDPCYGAISQRR
ncbi:MAG: S26 family signal peptidase [Candidatus Limnocylindria bacterium]